jgi:hypothetical protein
LFMFYPPPLPIGLNGAVQIVRELCVMLREP